MDHLDQYLGARNAVLASEDKIKRLAEQHGLSVVEFVIIAMVGRGTDRSSAIAVESGIVQSTVSHNISDLEERGLLERKRGGDARGFQLVLTERGQKIADTIKEQF